MSARDRSEAEDGTPRPVVTDVRGPVLGLAAWAGCLVGLVSAGLITIAVVLVAAAGAAWAWRRRRLAAACLLVGAGLCGHAGLQTWAVATGPVAEWAPRQPVVEVTLRADADAVLREGRYGDYVVLRATGTDWRVRGDPVRARAPVLVLADPSWHDVAWRDTVRTVGRLRPADDGEVAAVLQTFGEPDVSGGEPAVLRAAGAVRTSVRQAARAGPGHSDALVPALVTGDDERLPAEVVEDFRTAGLTHLTAVSGTNLTLVLASVLLLARWCGVRARALLVVGALCVVGFVLVARPEPSVLRAAAMGTVALVGMGSGGRSAGLRALGVAVVLLLAVSPGLARSPGFALSVCATAGILLVAPGVRDALAGWMPRWLAEAVAVPWAAQLACTPLVAGLSGEVSLVAVAANLLAAPAVGPATVLGLAGGVVGLVLAPVGLALGWLAGCCAWWVLAVAEQAARLPGASVGWSESPASLALLTVLCLAGLALTRRVVQRRGATLLATALLAWLVVRPLDGALLSPGWPPQGWVMVMCDVGQGDALVLHAGAGSGVVVDVGPEPALVDRCLERLGVERLPAVVLTHFHADHVSGLPGALEGREVGEVQVSPLREPAEGAALVSEAAAAVPVRVPPVGERVTVGELSWEVLGPERALPGSPNDASLVLLVEVRGARILLTGDAEPPEQAQLEALGIGAVDVLKVAHHGSRHQDHGLIAELRPRVALVSVGEDNDYGHPAPDLTAWLETSGVEVLRTDQDGDVAVVVGPDGALSTATR